MSDTRLIAPSVRSHNGCIGRPSKVGDLQTSLHGCEVCVKDILPVLASIAKSRIRSALGVSEPYSSEIRAGRCIPHPRHWQPLASLVGVSVDR